MAFQKAPLDERTIALRAELDQAIDQRVDQVAKDCPNVPKGVIRNSITRGLGCQCDAYLMMKRKDDEARGNAA